MTEVAQEPAQRVAATRLPVRALGPEGVIRMMFMEDHAQNRPTSGARSAELAAELREVRKRTLWLTEDLSAEQLMGPKLDIVNPVLWEIGHVGWFHEYWTLRQCLGRPPLIDRGDRLWDSSAVAHAARWHLDLPDRARTLAYLAEVLDRQLEHLSRGDPGERVRYFYDLSIRHEDMHVEALAYTRQTLGYVRPEGLGECSPERAGPWPGDAEVPGGTSRLSARPRTKASSSTTRNGCIPWSLRHSASRGPRSQTPSSPNSSKKAAIADGSSGAQRAGIGASA
jgi:hypothetical protein